MLATQTASLLFRQHYDLPRYACIYPPPGNWLRINGLFAADASATSH